MLMQMHVSGLILSGYFVGVLAQLLLPHILVGLGVQHGSTVLGQLVLPELVGVYLVTVIHGHVL
jgi:hypothetical protein